MSFHGSPYPRWNSSYPSPGYRNPGLPHPSLTQTLQHPVAQPLPRGPTPYTEAAGRYHCAGYPNAGYPAGAPGGGAPVRFWNGEPAAVAAPPGMPAPDHRFEPGQLQHRPLQWQSVEPGRAAAGIERPGFWVEPGRSVDNQQHLGHYEPTLIPPHPGSWAAAHQDPMAMPQHKRQPTLYPMQYTQPTPQQSPQLHSAGTMAQKPMGPRWEVFGDPSFGPRGGHRHQDQPPNPDDAELRQRWRQDQDRRDRERLFHQEQRRKNLLRLAVDAAIRAGDLEATRKAFNTVLEAGCRPDSRAIVGLLRLAALQGLPELAETLGCRRCRRGRDDGEPPGEAAGAAEVALAAGAVPAVPAVPAAIKPPANAAVVVPPWLTLSVADYAELLRGLVWDLAFRPAALRLLLNLAVAKKGDAVPVVAAGSTEADIVEAFAVPAVAGAGAATPVGPRESSNGSSSDSDDVSDAGAVDSDTVEDGDAKDGTGGSSGLAEQSEPELHLVGCEAISELNGKYMLTEAYAAFDAKHIVYTAEHVCSTTDRCFQGTNETVECGDKDLRKLVSDGLTESEASANNRQGPAEDSGLDSPAVCFYWEFSTVRKGWWIGAKYGSSVGLLGHCPSDTASPPRSGWHIEGTDGRRDADPARFLTTSELQAEQAPSPLSGEQLLETIALDPLLGRVVGYKLCLTNPPMYIYICTCCMCRRSLMKL